MEPLSDVNAILCLAIEKEEEAYRIYARAATRARSDSIRQRLQELAQVEQGHKAKLQDIMAGNVHLVGGAPVAEWLVGELQDDESGSEAAGPLYPGIPFYSKQIRIALRNCGFIDPERIEAYVARDGYQALAKASPQMSPGDVIAEMKDSGLRGRGGAGFLTGLKWEFAARSRATPKYVICNADEGDPGAFMDRSILEGDPHAVVEGMTIAAYAIGAREGYIYCRAEYPLAIQRLRTAIAQAQEYGLLGQDILGSGFSLDLHIKEGAGAFVCGEETALIASIEGRRGEPRPRPPFPAVSGLWNRPSNVNNVKSYAMTPQIIWKGADWFRNIGTAKSPGTAIFALTGKINNTGLIEVPMGIPLGEIIFDVGGGVPEGKKFKAVQTGGPLGGCLPASALNTLVDFDSLTEAGATMGSGGMIVVDEDTCMVEFARYFLRFATAESCGKCVPCRIGGVRLLEVLTRISEGEGRTDDLALIQEISRNMQAASLCALGQLTPGPVMSALRFFQDEFRAHIEDKVCSAGQCKPLVRAKCINACPAGIESPAYLALVAQGRYAEGLAIHRQRNPFALVCGRVCPAFCEQKCRRGEIDEPISIRLVKRFMSDQEYANPWTPERLDSPKPERVAVVGAGPAGLTAALRLAQRGYQVTVFEKLPLPGGMMTVGIPEYRLPREPLFAEIENIQRAGVEIRCNQALGADFTLDDLLVRDGYSAVILAIGSHKSRRLGVAGEEKQGVIHGTDFLREVALNSDKVTRWQGDKVTGTDNLTLSPGRRVTLSEAIKGKRVAVVGGGDVAIDAVRTARRLGASEAHIVYRRQLEDMPAHKEEIEAAEQEGTQFHFLANPLRVLGGDRVCELVIQRQKLGEFDSSGRRRPMPVEGDEYTLDVDVVIPAIGQATDISWLPAGGNGAEPPIQVTRSGTFDIQEAFNTTRPGVFAAGDAVSGPATVIQAVAHGNLVAVAVDQWLKVGGSVADWGAQPKPSYVTKRPDIIQLYNLDDYATAHRPPTPERTVAERIGDFREVELGYDEQTAREEAKRCLRCDLEWLDLMKIPGPTRVEAE
ncbi:MAG: hydrogenase [Chloroflexi bacterium HGW-Chloroflexi-1]|nr:MAG: hydrogenase [Chloroflexi bacterium HGW-Chloroflexi-1]